MAAAIVIVLFGSVVSIDFWFAIATLFAVTFFSVGKSILRLKAVRLVLTQYGAQIRRQMFAQSLLWVVTQPIFFYNCLAALFSRRIEWRGKRYEMVSASKTNVLER